MRARFVLSFVLLFALAFPALAQDRRGGLDRILPQVSRTVPGTFYDAEGPFMTPDGRATYRIKWMTPDGRIIWLTVDAQTGQVMGGIPSGPPPSNRFRNDDYSNRDRDDSHDRRNNWRGDDRGNGNWNGGGWSGDNGGRDHGNWNRGDSNRGGHGSDGNRGGRDRGGDHGGNDRRHGG